MSQALAPRQPHDTRTDQQIKAQFDLWLESCEGERPDMPNESPADSVARIFWDVYGNDYDKEHEERLLDEIHRRDGDA